MVTGKRLSRRCFIVGAATAGLVGPREASAGVPGRIVVLDWALAETLVALGVAPLAVAEAPLYAHRVIEPALPAGTADAGLRSWPNLEGLRALRPDLILMLEGYGISPERMEQIAPVRALPLYTAQRQPLRFARETLADLAALTGRAPHGALLLADLEAALEPIRTDAPPVLIVKFADDRIIDIYGAGSLFHDVLLATGRRNAWTGPTNNWGFASAGLEEMARHPDSHLVVIEPAPPERLTRSAIWQALPQIRTGRVSILPPVWVFGGVPAATRFATLLGAA